MHIDEMIPSKYIKASDLKGKERVVVISHLEQAEFKNKDGKQEKKWIVFFVGKQKGMALNVTNIKKLGKLLGPENKNWPGKSIAIYPTETSFGGEEVDCIRIHAAAEAGAPVNNEDPPPEVALQRPAPTPKSDPAREDYVRPSATDYTADMSDEIPF